MGALVAYTAVGTHVVSMPAYGWEKPPVAEDDSQAQNAPAMPPRRFNIQAGLLDTVLTVFQNESQLQIVVPRDAIRSLNSPGVSGTFTPPQALEKLLEGTGVSFRFTDTRTVTLDLANHRSSLEVRDSLPQLSSPRYTQPLVDTPQTIMVIPKAVMEEQGATTLRDVLRNVPGLTVSAGEGGTPAGDNITLRGFSARNDMFVDGFRDISTQSRDPFNMEQVEVTKGPTSAVSGRGSAGGTINMVSKAPHLNRMLGGTLNLGNDGTARITGDLNTPLDKIGLGERTAFRLNSMYHHSNVNGRDAIEFNRWGVAPSLAFGVGTPTRVTLSYFKNKQDNISDYGIPWVPATNNALVEYRDRPAPVPRNTFYGLKNRDFEKLNQDMATVRAEHDFSDNLQLRNQFRYSRSGRDSMASPPRFASNDSTDINREMRSWIATDKVFDNQTDLTARFSTGAIRHAVSTGAQFTWENNIRKTRSAPNMLTTLYNPNPNDVYTSPITMGTQVGDVTGKTQALYLFDTVQLGRKWQANGGFRWERFDVNGISTAAATVQQLTKMTSTRAGLVYKPTHAGSVYYSYGTSLSPSLEGLSYNTSNTSIPPEKTYTNEIGTKWNVLGDRLMLSGAIFQVAKDNARTPGILPDDPPQVLSGRQRVRGIEMGVTGSITRNWKMMAAYTYMNPRIIGSNTAAEVGKRFINTPQNSGSIWTSYTIKRLTFGGGPRWVGKRYGNNTNTRFVESYWTIDGMASFPVARFLDLRLNLYNLNNAYYFDRMTGGQVVPGAARTVNGSLAFRF